MDKNTENYFKIKPDMRLSKEELLNGRAAPQGVLDETETKPPDPRLRSPDELLGKAKMNNQAIINRTKKQLTEILKGGTQFSDPINNPPVHEDKKEGSHAHALAAQKIEVLRTALLDMKNQYHKEIDRWKLYEQQVNDWKDSVLTIVQQLKNDLIQAKAQINENNALQDLVHDREEEIKKLRKKLQKFKKK